MYKSITMVVRHMWAIISAAYSTGRNIIWCWARFVSDG